MIDGDNLMRSSHPVLNLSLIVTLSIWSFSAWGASDQVGTITQAEGTVKIFTDPSKTLQKDSQDTAPRALFEGEYYRVRDAKPGDRVEKGNILRTAPASKARVIFDNGDQYNVGPATAYRVTWEKDSDNTRTDVHMMYGKLRGVVAKGGPRSKLFIRTRSATMGVRGTDFFIADDGVNSGTEVSVLRGQVEVKPQAPKAKPVEVKSGYSAAVPSSSDTPPLGAPVAPVAKKEKSSPSVVTPQPVVPVVELRKTTQEELVGIQKTSQVKKEHEPASAPPEVTKKLQLLETKAIETTLKDVKAADPKLYAQVKNEKFSSPEQINAAAVQTLLKEAPKAPVKRKRYQSEFEDVRDDAYEKYFKIE